ncbi:hypothetical protein EES45_23175 [Streptomyces sp. ADI97-07]|uniref:hypothetical protein n=1 Tax=Streptomyces sp. ADI97-07 TaxID=1522762 RepID=UPI000F907243|nr:hypothetical protein [Streptomyces sp. ADI97-07]RPK76397.1 hypothetical protein EES45_23175 [Streptomyces sp. ADI97-07]
MKLTSRDEWRVMVTLKPRRPADLGLTGLDDLAEFVALPGPLTVAVLPRRLGDFGFVSMGDRMASRDIEADYRQRCDEIARELRHRPQVEDVTVTCTETHTCSHCSLLWEVLTADEAANHSTNFDEHSVEGEPVCCDKSIAEFRTERGIPQINEGVVAFRNPDRPGVLLCREHGAGWGGMVPLRSEDLPDGGVCTHGDPAEPSKVCGRDVLIGGVA